MERGKLERDFTKKIGYGRFPYQEIGLKEYQIDSIFATYDVSKKEFLAKGPRFLIEEIKVQVELGATGHKECTQNPIPDIPVHFIMAGGWTIYPDETPTIYDRKKMFRINNMKTLETFFSAVL